ncbi:sugar-binding transcriptional regulator [Gilliamella sp. wkB108]|uniref:sugar-binding transcriptional regulator n=1 Tax=Gilliamella sp. wkB108 TaxID=3120256 RepID=UPI0009BE68D3|nr:sugar-binding domain-containing protein [Gilliamella apicola]
MAQEQPLHRIKCIIVSKMFFLDGKTKSQIAEETGMSRFKVARLINDAIESKLVTFTIAEQTDIDPTLSNKLCQKFKLQNVIVQSNSYGINDPQMSLNEKLGRLAASYLEESLEMNMKIGIAWGKVLCSTARSLKTLPPLEVVQTTGAYPNIDFEQNSIGLVQRIAKVSKGKAYPIYLPMWVEDKETAKQLRMQTGVSEVRKKFDDLDVLITGIGSWTTPSSCMYTALPQQWKDNLFKKDVCADICTIPLDKKGNVLTSPLDDLGFGITVKQVKKVPQVIAVAGGIHKFDAILATLKSGLITTLITDAENATMLLEHKS